MQPRTKRQAYLLLAAMVLAAAANVRAQQTQSPAANAAPQPTAAQPPAPVRPAPPDQADVTPGAIHTAPRAEPEVEGFTRKSADAVELTLPGGKKLVLHDFDFNGDAVDTSKLHLSLVAAGVYELTALAYDTGYWRFYVADAASYYGFGERFDTLDHAHTVVHNLSLDTPGPKGSSTYKPIPFFMSTTGYGFWLDTGGDATFDLNATDRDQITVDFVANRLRIFLFTGAPDAPGEFPAILSAFTKRTQRAILPPYWAFAPWQARDFHQNQDQVLEDVQKTRELGLPASVLLIDSPWATAYNSYEFNPKQFDDAPGMVKNIHENGFKLVLWHTSWIDNKSNPPGEPGFEGKIDELSPNYQVAADRGFFIQNQNGSPYVGRWWKGQGSLIDFTNPKATEWWQNQLRLAIDAGADGFKDDDAEGGFITTDVKFADGTDPRMMRNRYATLYNDAVEDVIQSDLKGNGVLFARSVTAGANGLGFLWAGDNEASFSQLNGLPTVVTAGISAGLSGMPLWACDLGGYLKQPDTPNPKLLQRWTEFSAFTPTMEGMSAANLSPWTFDSKPSDRNGQSGAPAFDTYKKFATLHMSLFPYRYAAAQQAALTGMPIMRALVLDYQDDPRARAIKDEYLFGPDLLVAPVVDENTSRAVYLPTGDWINLFTGEQIIGPLTIVAKAPLDTIPVYAKRGTVLPKIPEDVMTLVPEAESGNAQLHTLDQRRVYEIIGNAADADTKIVDFERRTLVRSGNSLAITPAPPGKDDPAPDPKAPKTHVILRWRFIAPHSASVNGSAAAIQADRNGTPTIEFDLSGPATITWQ
jgi:alpha-D-xyloside xylohydrolase